MSVIIETSKGCLFIDVHYTKAPKAAKNFLKLCKMKYYNNCLFFNVQRDFLVQTGDPTNTGKGGSSVYGYYILYCIDGSLVDERNKYFEDEFDPELRHNEIGTLSMANRGPNTNASQFFITCGPKLNSLDDVYTVFGSVYDGFDVLNEINTMYADKDGKPMQAIRIKHVVVVDDPFPDDLPLAYPEESPDPVYEFDGFIAEDVDLDKDLYNLEKQKELLDDIEDKKAKAGAAKLEIIGDIPDAELKPPDNVLFICKLNPHTTEEGLRIIFGKFGKVEHADIIMDVQTGMSQCYGFIEFADKESCENAYFKANNILIDERRVKVDFSQSLSRINWKQQGGWRNFFKNRARELNTKRGRSPSDRYSNENKRRRLSGDRYEPRRDDRDRRYRDDGRERSRGRRDDRDRRYRDDSRDRNRGRRDDRDRRYRDDSRGRRDDRDRRYRDDSRERSRGRRDDRDRRYRDDSRDRNRGRDDRDRRDRNYR